MITVASLVAAGIAPTQARLFAEPLTRACARFEINTPLRVAGFVAQCRVESKNFTALEEDLYYRKPERIMLVFSSRVRDLQTAQRLVANPKALGNYVYASRFGNGDEASGDGWKFRGRGLKQITFQANYLAAEKAIGRPYTSQPDLVALPDDACLTAAHYYMSHGCNTLADSAQWDAITAKVNPAMLQARDRAQFSAEGVLAFT